MRYGNILKRDIANGIGVRVTIFVSGCTHHCKNCFQPQTWNFDFGEPFTKDTEDELLEALSSTYITGLTLLGGEPFEPANQRALVPFLHRVKEELEGKDIWAFSGYTLEELQGKVPNRCHCEVTDEMLSLIDVLVDGPFIEEQKDISLRFRGSANQRLINLPATLNSGEIVLWDDGGRK